MSSFENGLPFVSTSSKGPPTLGLPMPLVAVAMRFRSMRARSSRKKRTSAAPAMTKTTPALSVKGCTAN
jgi:hypothetical protein